MLRPRGGLACGKGGKGGEKCAFPFLARPFPGLSCEVSKGFESAMPMHVQVGSLGQVPPVPVTESSQSECPPWAPAAGSQVDAAAPATATAHPAYWNVRSLEA